MKIPPSAIIPDEKLTRYLLVPREYDDKSKFLSKAGFTLENPEILKRAIQRIIDRYEATEDGENEYGKFYRVDGLLEGTEGRNLAVIPFCYTEACMRRTQ